MMVKTSPFLVLCLLGMTFAQEEIEGSGEGSGEGPDSRVEFEEQCKPPVMDLIFLLDTSGSVKYTYTDNIHWMTNLVAPLDVQRHRVKVATVMYAGYPLTEFALNTYSTKIDIVNHLNVMRYRSGVTRTGSALRKAQDLFKVTKGGRPDAKKVIVVFTDGLSIDNPQVVAKSLREVHGVTIYAVAIDKDAYIPELSGITGNSDHIFRSGQFDDLKAKILQDSKDSQHCQLVKLTKYQELPVVNTNGQEIKKICITKYPENPERAVEECSDGPVTEITKQGEQVLIPIGADVSQTSGESSSESSTEVKKGIIASKTCILGNSDEEGGPSGCLDGPVQSVRKEEESSIPVKKAPVESQLSVDPHNVIYREENLLSVTKSRNTVLRKKECPLDILVLLDSSGSLQNQYIRQKFFLKRLVNSLKFGPSGNTRLALIQFAGIWIQRVEFGFNTFKSHVGLNRAVDQIRHFTGVTYIGSALVEARNVLKKRRKEASTIVILISDGYSQDEASDAALALRRLPGVKLYAVGLADHNDSNYLRLLTGSPNSVFVGESQASTFIELIRSRSVCFKR